MKVGKGSSKPVERPPDKYKPLREGGFTTGWCGRGAADWSHERCRGSIAGVDCTCSCHA